MNIKSAVLKISTSFLLIAALFSLSACSQSAAAGDSARLSEDEAKNIALEDCGLSESEIKNKKSALDTEDGVLVYEIEFYSDTHEYEYEIDANSGKIMKKSKEVYGGPVVQTVQTVQTEPAETPAAATTAELAEATAAPPPASTAPSSVSPYISAEDALNKALAHAGLDRGQVFGIETELDADDGIAVYEVQFQKDNIEYEYEIDASSGAVIEFETDIED